MHIMYDLNIFLNNIISIMYQYTFNLFESYIFTLTKYYFKKIVSKND